MSVALLNTDEVTVAEPLAASGGAVYGARPVFGGASRVPRAAGTWHSQRVRASAEESMVAVPPLQEGVDIDQQQVALRHLGQLDARRSGKSRAPFCQHAGLSLPLLLALTDSAGVTWFCCCACERVVNMIASAGQGRRTSQTRSLCPAALCCVSRLVAQS